AAVAILDALARGRLIGRVAELAEARELWRRAREGRGHAVLLSGEPGAGKTRLAREISIQAAVDGAVVLSGGCYEYEATTPYLPFVEAFRRWVREQQDDDAVRAILGDAATQIAKLAPEIATRLGPFPDRPELPPHEERLLFFDAVAQVFANLARNHGLLFYADDLHWTDSGTLRLLAHLLRHLREDRVLILGAYRETELDRAHPLAKALVDWNRERLVTRIALRRFDQQETNAQLSALLGERISADFSDAVHRETEGNPFFVEEVLKALIEQGSVRRESGRWQRCDVNELLIPQSMKEAIGHRLNRASPACNETLRAAAVLGKTFTFEELKAATGDQGEDALLDALDEAVGAQLITADRGESFIFTHDKIREVLYEEMNPIRRRRLHRHAAEGLERSRATAHVAVETLAHHFIQAGDYERGLTYAKQSAAEAERMFAFDDAIAAYGRARDCAETLGMVDEQMAQEESIGKAYMIHGDLIPAGEHFERALALTNDAQVRARLQSEMASSLVATGDQRGLELLREALSVLDPVANPLETAHALALQGRFHHLAGSHKKAIEFITRAADLIAQTAEAETVSTLAASTISMIYAYLAGGYQHLGLFNDADRWAKRAIEFGAARNVLFAQALGFEFLGEHAINTGAHAAGLEYAERERQMAEKLHSRERRAWTHFGAAMNSVGRGDDQRAEREFTDGIALAESIGDIRVAALLKGNLAVLQADQAVGYTGGMYGVVRDEAAHQQHAQAVHPDQAVLDRALKTALENFQAGEKSGLLYSRMEGRRTLAHVHFRRGELEEAERLCAEASQIVSPTESQISRLWLGPIYVEVLVAAGKRAEAVAYLKNYQELVSQCQTPRFTKEAARLATLVNET
ncbi:MAG: ATP-binding protein, partial [Acidobacteriota bacterium]